jgi:cytochrome c oxidase subunit 3
MSVVLLFLVVVAGIAGWWLSQQRLMSQPWLEQGADVGNSRTESGLTPAAKIGLGLVFAVIGCLFSLLASAYFIRMDATDWRAPPLPTLLWLNTGILILSSVALHVAVVASRKGQPDTMRLALVTGGLTSLTFLAGQLVAWRELSAGGYLLNTNPANSFFYLLTGLHGLHIVGGLVALGRTTARAWSGAARERLQLSIELCAAYWHFLLFIWLCLFVLLAGWAGNFLEICRGLLS